MALVYDGLCLFEFASAAEVFGLPRPEAGAGWYRFSTASVDGRAVATQYGGRVVPDGGLRLLERAGTVVVPGWAGADVPVPAALLDALRTAHCRGARLLSICSGAFVLAATGLLDGRRVATHWRYADALRQRRPAAVVDANVLYVDDGALLTSAGSASGLDLSLHLVRRDFGTAMANLVARRLVIPPHRDGSQAQYVRQPVAPPSRDAFAPVLDRMRERLAEPHPLPALAALAHTSERTFLRRFRAATGTSPAAWLTGIRLDHAKHLLESTRVPIDQVAERSGFGTATTLRHHFRRRLAISPARYRQQFGNAAHGGPGR